MALLATHLFPPLTCSSAVPLSLSLSLSLTHQLLSLSLCEYMAAMQSLTLSSTFGNWQQKRRSFAAASLSQTVYQRSSSSFHGKTFHIPALKRTHIAGSSITPTPVTMMAKPAIQFIQGTDERTIPEVSLTKSRDGTNGVATFIFDEPSVFDSSSELGEITGFYMIDEEGVLQSTNVNAKFVNGKPSKIEAKYVMRNPRDWDRFMRFMERYSNANGLQFIKK